MAVFCTVAGIVLGGLFALTLICPFLLYGTGAETLWAVVIGVLSGGTFGFVFGLISGGVMAKATDADKLYNTDVDSYKRSMQHLSQSVALGGVFLICVLAAVSTIPNAGWEAWLGGVVAFVLVPGVIAFFVFRWASRRVADWALQNVQDVQEN